MPRVGGGYRITPHYSCLPAYAVHLRGTGQTGGLLPAAAPVAAAPSRHCHNGPGRPPRLAPSTSAHTPFAPATAPRLVPNRPPVSKRLPGDVHVLHHADDFVPSRHFFTFFSQACSLPSPRSASCSGPRGSNPRAPFVPAATPHGDPPILPRPLSRVPPIRSLANIRSNPERWRRRRLGGQEC